MSAHFSGFEPGPHPQSAQAAPKPFGSAEAAWMWTWSMLEVRRDGAGMRFGSMGIRPCEPDDVVKVLDRLFRDGKVTIGQAHLLRVYGERGRAPNPQIPAERADVRPWAQAMLAMDWPLMVKGIVSGRPGVAP